MRRGRAEGVKEAPRRVPHGLRRPRTGAVGRRPWHGGARGREPRGLEEEEGRAAAGRVWRSTSGGRLRGDGGGE